MYLAYEISHQIREELAERFPPQFPDFIGHHITKVFGVMESAFPEETVEVSIIGYVAEAGLEALVVAINGSTKRPDGKPYHITWSLDRALGKAPKMSNDLIEREDWVVLQKPYTFTAELRLFS